ncbi:MAG: hypothetical protein WC831_05685 [Parcubacteria group bacterium]|jgi:hypothetical protein
MSLRDVEKNIYQRDDEEGRPFSYSQINPREAEENPFSAASFEAKKNESNAIFIKEIEEKKWQRNKKIKKISLISAAAALVLAGLVWGVIYYRKSAFSEDQVKVSVSGPEKVQSGDLVSFDIDYQNLNRAGLRDAVLHINYPENFKPEGDLNFESDGPNSRKQNVGTIDGRGSGKVILKGKFFGPKDLLVYVDVSLDYSSSNFSSTFTTKNKAAVFISSSPLSLEMNGPQSVVAGNAVSYVVKYQNTGQEEMKDLKIKVDYPREFSYISSEPLPPSDNNVWYAGNLGAGQSGEVKFNGTLNGLNGETKNFKAAIGQFGSDGEFIPYNEAASGVKILASPVKIEQTINNSKDSINVNAGEMLSFKVKYQNTGTVGLRDVIISEEIKSPVLDYTQINMPSGEGGLDSQNGIITWKASDIPKLKSLNPGDGGEIVFSIPIKEVIPVSGSGDKNFTFSAVVRADSPDIPTPEGSNKIISGNTVGVKLNSKLGIATEGYYNDAEISNSGPIPPKVGGETTFTLHLKLLNVSNDVTDAKVTAVLASGVKWKNSFLPQSADVIFNDRTNELTWDIGSMPAGIGVLTDPRELVFQVGLVPSQNQVGDYASLLAKTVFSANDTFTKQKLEISSGGKNTNLMEDMGVGDLGEIVN